jgi:hypothetical protein
LLVSLKLAKRRTEIEWLVIMFKQGSRVLLAGGEETAGLVRVLLLGSFDVGGFNWLSDAISDDALV